MRAIRLRLQPPRSCVRPALLRPASKMRRFTRRLSMDSRYRSAPARITLAALGAIAAAAAALGVAAWSGPAQASEHWMPSDCLPPPNSVYTAALHQQYAAGFIDLRNPRHMDFTSCDPPPALVGGSTVH